VGEGKTEGEKFRDIWYFASKRENYAVVDSSRWEREEISLLLLLGQAPRVGHRYRQRRKIVEE